MSDNQVSKAEKSALYDKNTRISLPGYDAMFSIIQSYFRMQLDGRDASLLVVGAGTGNELAAWGPSNPGWTFAGVDPSEEMIGLAQYKAEQLNLTDRVKLFHGTVEDLPLEEAKFDAASCLLVLHFVQDMDEKLELLRNVKARLKPGAPFAVVCGCGESDSGEMQTKLNIWKSFRLDNGIPKSKVDELDERIKDLSLLTEEEIKSQLTEAGFTHPTRFFSSAIMTGWICHAEQ
ncbi:class I SAM-dependent methyltransferase [Paenibacillus pasadenensis]|uniref:class I SAM-dependent methyltransferase n=1 Tax=Paenibacillus pasadenensis TaxID=217090 RepID=UPI00203F4017|nr:class I SAM-dependent methyltransferase [Paenibacillus pasadenensis]